MDRCRSQGSSFHPSCNQNDPPSANIQTQKHVTSKNLPAGRFDTPDFRTVPFFNARKQGTMGAPRQLRKRNDNFSKNITKVGVIGVELDGMGSRHAMRGA